LSGAVFLVGIDTRVDVQGNPIPQAVLDQLHAGSASDGADVSDAMIVVHIAVGGAKQSGSPSRVIPMSSWLAATECTSSMPRTPMPKQPPPTTSSPGGVLRRAVAWFAERGVHVERMLSDNGSAYRSCAWRDACAELGVTPTHTRPYRPRPTAKSRGSITLAMAGPSPASFRVKPPAAEPYRPGYTSTTIPGPTLLSAVVHRSAG
jgi:hypothetical protein